MWSGQVSPGARRLRLPVPDCDRPMPRLAAARSHRTASGSAAQAFASDVRPSRLLHRVRRPTLGRGHGAVPLARTGGARCGTEQERAAIRIARDSGPLETRARHRRSSPPEATLSNWAILARCPTRGPSSVLGRQDIPDTIPIAGFRAEVDGTIGDRNVQIVDLKVWVSRPARLQHPNQRIFRYP